MPQQREQSIEEALASVPKLAPFTRFPVCPKCAYELGAGVPLLRWWFAARGNSAQAFSYCKGGSDENFQIPGMQMTAEGPRLTAVNMPTLCFGVYEEHIHCKCGRCDFFWLMAVRSK